MTISAERGDLVLDIMSKTKPKVMMELGGYFGYSAIKFSRALRDAGCERYLSLEAGLEYA
jgi:catechol O-methyltransferase